MDLTEKQKAEVRESLEALDMEHFFELYLMDFHNTGHFCAVKSNPLFQYSKEEYIQDLIANCILIEIDGAYYEYAEVTSLLAPISFIA